MELAKIEVTGTRARVIWSRPIPKGIVGATISVTYKDPVWDGLVKTVVFRGCVTRDVVNAGEVVTIPHEVAERANTALLVGISGTDAENNLVIPTFWADLGTVRPAADPSGDPSADPSLPAWEQVLQDSVKLQKQADETLTAAEEAQQKAEQAQAGAEDAATAAAGSAQQAAQSETNADQSAKDAAASAGAAAASEKNAKSSETQASSSAKAAGISETNAKSSEQKAAESAEAARRSAESINIPAPSPDKVGKAIVVDPTGGGYTLDDAGVKISNTATPGQLIIVKSVDENGKPTEWEAVDRTHWTEIVSTEEITFDGDMTGKISFDMSGNGSSYAVFVSESILAKEDVIGKPIVAMMDGQEMSETVAEDTLVDLTALGYSGVNGFAGMYGGNTPIAIFVQEGVEGFPAGTYFVLHMPFGVPYAYIKSLVVDRKTVHKLDNKYLNLDWLPTIRKNWEEILPETQSNVGNVENEQDDPYVMFGFEPDLNFSLVAGDTYKVLWNGTEHICIAQNVMDGLAIALGDGDILSGSSFTGTFCIATVADGGNGLVAGSDTTVTELTLSIQHERKIYNQMPIAFIDTDDIAFESHTMPNSLLEETSYEEYAKAQVALKQGKAVYAKVGSDGCTVLNVYIDRPHESGSIWCASNNSGIYHISTWFGVGFTPTYKRAVMTEHSSVNFQEQPNYLYSPNETKYRLVVDNEGNLSTEAVTT